MHEFVVSATRQKARGVRAEADAAVLRAEHPGIEPIAIDVTDAAAIAAARQRLERELDGFSGAAWVWPADPDRRSLSADRERQPAS